MRFAQTETSAFEDRSSQARTADGLGTVSARVDLPEALESGAFQESREAVDIVVGPAIGLARMKGLC